jgi:hypothetical protein
MGPHQIQYAGFFALSSCQGSLVAAKFFFRRRRVLYRLRRGMSRTSPNFSPAPIGWSETHPAVSFSPPRISIIHLFRRPVKGNFAVPSTVYGKQKPGG